ncbi:helix-turn-helix transcriptional regulator [Utexia brackfieldae]|uniref:helix-turn-helix domain-containing protein n=1 Tax=Utexia brackfieldae TaxID=3074108 RepID=UPI00370D5D19
MDQNADVIALLCRRIKIARIRKNLSQCELAQLSGVGIATIKRIELGESVSLTTLISVLRGLDELDQLNNLLAHIEVGHNQQHQRKRKRKIVSASEESKPAIEHDFISTHRNNMHWKF